MRSASGLRGWKARLPWGAAALAVVAQAAVAQNAPAEALAGERFAVQYCASCHGDTGQSAAPNFPRLAGQSEMYLVKQLQDFASGKRDSPMMKEKVALMDDAMVRSLAMYYARQKAANTPSSDAQLMAVGQFVYERGNPWAGLPACQSCHSADAHGTHSLPRLAGQHPRYIEDQLKQFNQRERTNDNAVMHGIASKLSELELKSVAAYLSGLK